MDATNSNNLMTELLSSDNPDIDITLNDDSIINPTPPVVNGNRKRYLFGLFLIFCVVLLWVLSGVLIQSIFKEYNFNSPFFLTYFSTSLFIFYLCTYYAFRLYKKYFPKFHYHSIKTENNTINNNNNNNEHKEQDLTQNETSSLTNGQNSELHETTEIDENSQYPLKETMKISLNLCFLWFLMNYFYNLSLAYTSIASSTILSSTSSLFVLIFSIIWLKSKLRWLNLLGVAFTIAGAVLISIRDTDDSNSSSSSSSSNDNSHTAMGDVLAGISAIFYGFYTVYLKVKIPDDSRVSMQLILGFMGLFNFLILWPLFLIFDSTSIEHFQWPSVTAIGFLLLNGFLGTVVSDFLWAKSVIYTTPLISSVGLTLNIPLAIIIDNIWNHHQFEAVYILGSLLVLAGFVAVNWQNNQADQPSTTEINTETDADANRPEFSSNGASETAIMLDETERRLSHSSSSNNMNGLHNGARFTIE